MQKNLPDEKQKLYQLQRQIILTRLNEAVKGEGNWGIPGSDANVPI
jgi:hypothetical protein